MSCGCAALVTRSQQGPYPPSGGCLGVKRWVVAQRRTCPVKVASLTSPSECVRCSVSLQSGQEELRRRTRRAAGRFLCAEGEFLGGEELLQGAFLRKSWSSIQGCRAAGDMAASSSEMALNRGKEQDGLKGPKKLSGHQRASFWVSHVCSWRVEAQLAQARQRPPPHQSVFGFRLLQ